MRPTVQILRLRPAADLSLPTYMSDTAAGADLCADITQPITLAPGARGLVPAGVSLIIPEGYEGQVRPRSGLALRHGVTVLNSPGTIDADYRGEVQVLLINHGDADFVIRRGERIAQLVIAPVCRAVFEEISSLEGATTSRGAGGFGSTGK